MCARARTVLARPADSVKMAPGCAETRNKCNVICTRTINVGLYEYTLYGSFGGT